MTNPTATTTDSLGRPLPQIAQTGPTWWQLVGDPAVQVQFPGHVKVVGSDPSCAATHEYGWGCTRDAGHNDEHGHIAGIKLNGTAAAQWDFTVPTAQVTA